MTDERRVPYSERYFADRQEELDLALDKVRRLLQGESVSKRTTAFYGPLGSGKSWLIRELYQRLQEEEEFQSQVVVLYLTSREQSGVFEGLEEEDYFHVSTGEMEKQPELIMGNILEWALGRLGIDVRSVSPALDAMGTRLVERCREIKSPLALLVDGIDEVPPAFLELLEAYFLAPLIKEPRVLFILGGRTRDPRPGGGYTWKIPEIKLYSDECYLLPFDEKHTREQLDRLSSDYPITPEAADKTREAGGGYPFSNVILAQHISGDPPRWRDKGAALQECANTLLENVDKKLREYFWALCVLRGFDEDRMPPLLAVWFGNDESDWDYQRCRRIREEMVATRLARWERERGYVMDEAVRKPLENALKENQPQRWEALHQAAHKLYTGWVNRYPSAKGRWQPEAEYHAEQLRGCNKGG